MSIEHLLLNSNDPSLAKAFRLPLNGGICWIDVSREDESVSVAADPSRAAAGFALVQRRMGQSAALICNRDGVLINGLPALGFSVLEAGDSLRLDPGLQFFLSERFVPYAGKATPEMVGRKKCPFDQIPIDAETEVVTCYCGAVYHNETATTRPEVAAEDRLNCFEQVRKCLVCQRPLTAEPYLTWSPESL